MEKIPRDITFNIFSRLPLKSVIQSSCVSKPWLDIIKDPSFVKFYTSQSNPESSQLIMTRRAFGEKNIISFTPLKFEGSLLIANETPIDHMVSTLSWDFVGTCNGLLCFTSLVNEDEITMICNPVTREHIFLPKPSIIQPSEAYTPTLAFGFDIMSKSYKVVRILVPLIPDILRTDRSSNVSSESSGHVRTEVCTLGDNNSWREVAVVNFIPSGMPVYANGCVYWLAHNRDYKILSFDLGSENFKLIPHPNFGSVSSIRELRGCLSVIDLSSIDLAEIWILVDNQIYTWELEYVIPIRNPGHTHNPTNARPRIQARHFRGIGEHHSMYFHRLINVHEVDGLLIIWLKDELLTYEKRNFRLRDVKLSGFPIWLDWEICGGYRGSLVPLNGLGVVSDEKKDLVRFVSDAEMNCHLLAAGGRLGQEQLSDTCASLVASFQKYGLLLS